MWEAASGSLGLEVLGRGHSQRKGSEQGASLGCREGGRSRQVEAKLCGCELCPSHVSSCHRALRRAGGDPPGGPGLREAAVSSGLKRDLIPFPRNELGSLESWPPDQQGVEARDYFSLALWPQ